MRADIPVYKLLSGASDVTDIVAANIYPNVVPQGIKSDAITYQVVNTESYDGKGAYNDYHESIVQINLFCENYNTLGSLAESVRTALERQSGSFGTNTVIVVDNIFFQDSQDLGYLNDVKKYQKSMDFKIFTF